MWTSALLIFVFPAWLLIGFPYQCEAQKIVKCYVCTAPDEHFKNCDDSSKPESTKYVVEESCKVGCTKLKVTGNNGKQLVYLKKDCHTKQFECIYQNIKTTCSDPRCKVGSGKEYNDAIKKCKTEQVSPTSTISPPTNYSLHAESRQYSDSQTVEMCMCSDTYCNKNIKATSECSTGTKLSSAGLQIRLMVIAAFLLFVVTP